MMRVVFQYQGKAQPTGITAKETTQLDKWQPTYPAKIWAPVHGEFGGKIFQPVGILVGETIRPDKWLPIYPSIIWKVKPNVAAGYQVFPVGILAGETIRPDKWFPKYPDIIWKAKPLVAVGQQIYPVGIIVGETIKPDKWAPKYPDIIWKAKQPVATGVQVFTTGITNSEIIYPDKWSPRFNSPIARIFQTPEGGFFAPVLVDEAPVPTDTTVGRNLRDRYPRVYHFRDQRVVVRNKAQETEFLKYTKSQQEEPVEIKKLKGKRKEKSFTLKTIPDEEFYNYTLPEFPNLGAVEFDELGTINANYAAWQRSMDDPFILAILLA